MNISYLIFFGIEKEIVEKRRISFKKKTQSGINKATKIMPTYIGIDV